jgi:tetratricopeptide (TPR) repeat protein
MSGVFISYRRADSGGWAGRLKDHLEMRFGADLVWQDVDDIPAGVDWLEQIKRGVDQADAVLVVIGPRWLELGRQRLQDPRDVLRLEIDHALNSPKALVIPVFVGGAGMIDQKDLPEPLQPLALRQAVTMLDNDWQRSIQLLVEALREAVERAGARQPLRELHEQLYGLQYEFFDTVSRDARKALALAEQALSILDHQQPHYPQDGYLQLFRGYFEKNRAVALSEIGNAADAAAAVGRADRVFQAMRDELQTQLAGAYNGIASMAIVEGRFTDALDWLDRALVLVPNYQEALHDRELVLKQLGPQAKKGRSRTPAKRRRRS